MRRLIAVLAAAFVAFAWMPAGAQAPADKGAPSKMDKADADKKKADREAKRAERKAKKEAKKAERKAKKDAKKAEREAKKGETK